MKASGIPEILNSSTVTETIPFQKTILDIKQVTSHVHHVHCSVRLIFTSNPIPIPTQQPQSPPLQHESHSRNSRELPLVTLEHLVKQNTFSLPCS